MMRPCGEDLKIYLHRAPIDRSRPRRDETRRIGPGRHLVPDGVRTGHVTSHQSAVGIRPPGVCVTRIGRGRSGVNNGTYLLVLAAPSGIVVVDGLLILGRSPD